MKKILYIFPHPDDESFGPAPAISAQLRQGNEVYLLTLTKGEATSQRFKLNLSKQQMGEIRYREMQCVEKVLGLTDMTVLDLPDNELKYLDPIIIEETVSKHIQLVEPDILVTYAVHGISGFHDHLVTHAVVKRVFCQMKRSSDNHPDRLALFTRIGETDFTGKFRLEASTEKEIGFIENCTDVDMEKFRKALDCYKTYADVIEASKVKEIVTNEVPFEIFGEDLNTRLNSITEGL